jgi:hypothetical protein
MDSIGTELNQSLEKIVLIGLNLTLIIAIGVPLFFTTTQVISETEQSLSFQQFVQDVDETILQADQSQTTLTKHIIVPANVSLECEKNQLIFKTYMTSWYIVTRTYRCPIFLTSSPEMGSNKLIITVNETLIQITFQAI